MTNVPLGSVWNRPELMRSPMLRLFYPLIARLACDHFPAIEDLNCLLLSLDPPTVVKTGAPLCFVEQPPGTLPLEQQYEPRCYLTGELQMRRNNWHDLFNALVWMLFPKTKAVLNARHYLAMQERRAVALHGRGSRRDVTTLIDESGVIVAYADPELARLLRNFQWKELFWNKRGQFQPDRLGRKKGGMEFFLFGHSLCEKALKPYVGMTGHGLMVAVEQEFFSLPAERQVDYLDNLLSNCLAGEEQFLSPADLSPVPLLGIPGWAADNRFPEYYDNTGYFRSGRRRGGQGDNQ